METQMLMRVDEAAAALSISRSRIFALIAAGELPAVRLGRSVRISADALKRWVEEQSGDHRAQEAR